jgi:hypothetical protein
MTKREWQLAIPILMGVALCLAGFLYGQHLENTVDRMAALRVVKTVQGERVAVIVNHALHVLDVDGHRLARQDIQSLGLTESPIDMDWTVDAQQRVEAWFFDDTVPRVVRCAWNTEQARLTDCRNAMAGPQLKANARSLAVHLAVDAVGQRVFIADAKGNRVLVFDLDGKALARTDPEAVPLSFPNRLRYLGNDTLVVADNDNRRLAWLRVTPGQPPQLLRTLSSADHGQARVGRGKVTDAAFGPTGTLWMLAVKQGQKDGDVLVFDAQQHAVARAGLSDGADPLVIDALGDRALVADYTAVNLYRIDAQGSNLGEFGDAAFRSELGPLGAQIREGALWKTIAQVGGGIIMVAGLLLGWRYGEKPKKPGQFDNQAKAVLASLGKDAGELRFPVVLKQTVAYGASARKKLLALAFVIVPMIAITGMPLFRLDFTGKPLGVWWLPTFVALGIALAAAAFWLTWREHLQAIELRVTERKVGLFRNGEQVHAAPIQEVCASTNALLIGSKMIRFRLLATKTKAGPIRFDMDLLNRAVLSRLPQQNLVSDQSLAWMGFKNSHPAFKLMVGIAFLAAMAIAFYPYYR